jgi:putative peptidoglycan lipid II flippase
MSKHEQEPGDTTAGSTAAPPRRLLASSTVVAGAILLSRISGFLRDRFVAQFFGTSLFADVFRAALRMPNVLQNLLGEGTLSASFIPVYSELLQEGKKKEAGQVAGAILAILFIIAGLLALIGVLLAPVLVTIFLPGFEGERRELTITLTRILFPMTGVLVLSAWSLGVLNSHRHFFIPYVAPVLWNLAMIVTLFTFGATMANVDLVVALGWGALVGGALQFLIQLPAVLRLERHLRISLGLKLEGVRETLRNAMPALMGRGVVQLSGYVDMVLASLLAIGAVSAIGYANTIYILPVSLFGMSVAAAELPELSRQRHAAVEALRDRANAGLRRVAFFVVPTVVAFITLGDVFVAALYQTGEFQRADTLIVYAALIGYSIGLLASTSTRLFSSAFFALRDTRTPARLAAVRVGTAALLSFAFMTQFEPIVLARWGINIPAGFLSHWNIAGRPLGPLGLTLGAGLAAWLEWFLLRRRLRERIPGIGMGIRYLIKIGLFALLAAAAGWGVRMILPPLHPILTALAVLSAFGAVYLPLTLLTGVGAARALLARFKR